MSDLSQFTPWALRLGMTGTLDSFTYSRTRYILFSAEKWNLKVSSSKRIQISCARQFS